MFRKWLAEKIYPESGVELGDIIFRVRSAGYKEGYEAHKKEIADSFNVAKKGSRVEVGNNIGWVDDKGVLHIHPTAKTKRKYTKKADKPAAKPVKRKKVSNA